MLYSHIYCRKQSKTFLLWSLFRSRVVDTGYHPRIILKIRNQLPVFILCLILEVEQKDYLLPSQTLLLLGLPVAGLKLNLEEISKECIKKYS